MKKLLPCLVLTFSLLSNFSSFAFADNTANGESVVEYANKYLGTSYLSGGGSPESGFDCSGFVQYVYSHFGIDICRITDYMYTSGYAVSYDEAKAGDLILFYINGTCTHCAIYAGNGQMVHASNSFSGVVTSNVSDFLYDDFIVRRIL